MNFRLWEIYNNDTIFYNTIFEDKDIREIINNQNKLDIIKKILKSVLKLDSKEYINNIIINFNLENIRFSLEKEFGIEQISTILSIFNYIFCLILKKNLSNIDSFQNLESILDKHSIQAPPFAIKIFKNKEKRIILKYFSNFYNYYLLYEMILRENFNSNIRTLDYNSILPDLNDLDMKFSINCDTFKNLPLLNEYLINDICNKNKNDNQINDIKINSVRENVCSEMDISKKEIVESNIKEKDIIISILNEKKNEFMNKLEKI